VRTPLGFLKKKNTRQTDWVGKTSRHLAGDQRPLKDSVNLIKTQKEIKKPIKNQKPPSKTLERLPSGVANSASKENPPITIPGF
jgi:hypothetical protein